MSLTPEQEVVVSLLRTLAGTEERPAALGELVARTDAERLMQTLVRGRVVVALGVPLVEGAPAHLPDWFRDQVDVARSFARWHGLLQTSLTERLTLALDQRGIAAVPLKGVALADGVHGDLGARQSSDLDLLVHSAQLDAAMETVAGLGWSETPIAPPPGELPRLHRVLVHPEYPPVELHWRVHWYESAFAGAAIERATQASEGLRRLAPLDELACLLLFLARDGFAGLRLPVDLAAWWRVLGDEIETGAVREIADHHPPLAPALGAAAVWTESVLGLERGSILGAAPELSRSQRAALRLANPWQEGSGHQIEAEVSLINGLLAPTGSVGRSIRRDLVPPVHDALTRDPELVGSSRVRIGRARAAHSLRVAARYVLATRRLARARP